MDLEQQLRAALAPRSAGTAVREAVLARLSTASPSRGPRRAGKRGILIGGLAIAIAAAAAMHGTWWPAAEPVATVPAEDTSPVRQPAMPVLAEPSHASPAPAFQPPPVEGATLRGSTSAPGTATNAAAPRLVLQVLTAEESAREAVARDAGSNPQILATRQQRAEILSHPAMRAALGAFHAALLDELNAIPGLRVVDADAADFPLATAPSYRLTIDSLSQGSGSRATDEATLTLLLEARQVPAAEPDRPALAPAQINLKDQCPTSTAVVWPPCNDARVAAANAVFHLAAQMFPQGMHPRPRPQPPAPPVSAEERRQQVREMNAQYEQTMAQVNAHFRTPEMGEDFVRQAATADVEERGRLWKVIRGSGHAQLIDPLLASAMNDPDAVRIPAVAALVADFAEVPRVRTALAILARENTRPVVRGLVRRALEGEDAWIDHIATMLNDTTLTPARRAESFVYHYNDVPLGPLHQPLRSIDPGTLRTLAVLLPEAIGDLPEDVGSRTSLPESIGRAVRQDAIAIDRLLRLLDPQQPVAVRKTAAEMLTAAGRFERSVLEALVNALEKDADPTLRDWGIQGREVLTTRP